MSTSNFPIIQAIESIMKLPVGGGSLKQYGGLYTLPSGGQVVVADYRCCQEGDEEGSAFAYLWGIAGPAGSSEAAANALLESIGSARCIVLVEGGGGGQGSCTSVCKKAEYSSHLRAVDWVLAIYFALMQRAGGSGEKIKLPPVCVLDVSPKRRDAAPENFDTRGLYGLCVFRACDGTDALTEFAKHLGDVSSADQRPAESVVERTLMRLARQWMASLAYAGDAVDSIRRNHLLNNLLGPLALAVELDRSGKQGLRNDVATLVRKSNEDKYGRRALMRAIEWTSLPGQDATLPLPELSELPIGDRELRILVLDDQIEDGWIPVLAHVVGVPVTSPLKLDPHGFTKMGMSNKGNISLWVTANPDAVRKTLALGKELASDRASRYKDTGLPKHLRFTAGHREGEEPSFDEILLLDLRLFGGDEQRAGAFTQFEKDVLDALNELRPANLESWPCDDPHDAKRLTGLARLISRRDCTYPVIIWSTTGQRHILEKLLAYGNIGTGLRKPKFDSYGSGERSFAHVLKKSLVQAQVFNETRHWLYQTLERPIRLQNNAHLYSRIRKQVGEAQQTSIFLSIDESAKQHGDLFRHGGIAMVCSERRKDGDALPEASWWHVHMAILENIIATTTISLMDRDGVQITRGLHKFEKYFFEPTEVHSAFKNSQDHLSKGIRGFQDLAVTRNSIQGCPHIEVTCIPIVAMATAEDKLPKIDALHLENIKTLILASLALASSDLGSTALRVEIDGRNIPIDLNSRDKQDWEDWFAGQHVDDALREQDRAITGAVSRSGRQNLLYRDQAVGRTQFIQGTPFLLRRTSKETVDVFSQSVTAPVVHAVVSSAMRQVSARLPNLHLVGALTMSSTERSPASTVLNTMADYIPRFAISNDTRKLNTYFRGEDSIFFADMSASAPSLPKLIDLFFGLPMTGTGLLAGLFDIIQRKPADLRRNSFQSILLARIADAAVPSLSSQSFWHFSAMWHSLQDRVDGTIVHGVHSA